MPAGPRGASHGHGAGARGGAGPTGVAAAGPIEGKQPTAGGPGESVTRLGGGWSLAPALATARAGAIAGRREPDALCFMVKTWTRHKTTEARLNNGWWRLAVGGGWRWLAVGGPWGLSLTKKKS